MGKVLRFPSGEPFDPLAECPLSVPKNPVSVQESLVRNVEEHPSQSPQVVSGYVDKDEKLVALVLSDGQVLYEGTGFEIVYRG